MTFQLMSGLAEKILMTVSFKMAQEPGVPQGIDQSDSPMPDVNWADGLGQPSFLLVGDIMCLSLFRSKSFSLIDGLAADSVDAACQKSINSNGTLVGPRH